MYLRKQPWADRSLLWKIDIPNNSLNVDISDEEMAARKAKWQPREPKIKDGYLLRYAALVTSGNRGAVLDVNQLK